MFVHYSGNKAAFAAATNAEGALLSKVYENHIVFIKGEDGECIYTHGQYYGDVKAAIAALEGRMSTAEGKISANETAIKANDDAIKALKYFSQIKVGDKTAVAANKEGTITFSAADPQEVSIDVDARGLSFGLSEAFKTKVNTAASQAAAAAVKSEVDTAIEELQGADLSLGNRIATLEGMVGLESGGEGESLDARLSTAEGEIDALQLLVGTGTVDSRIATAKSEAATDAQGKADAAESAAKLYADGLNTAMNTRMESAEGSISTLTGLGEGSVAKALVDAKAYTDEEIVKVNNAASTLEGRVANNEAAIVILNGEGVGSVKKQVADAIAGVVASAPEDFDTLKEVADWIASDTTGAAKMQADIARLDGADTVDGSVKKQIKDAVAAEALIARAAEQANAKAIADEATEARKQEGLIRSEFAAADAATLTSAQNYADGLASNYDAAGSAATAEQNAKDYAKDYADGLAANYDEVGAAAAVDAKLTTEVNRAKAAEQANAEAIGVERGRIDVIAGNYLKSADKTELQGNIDLKVAQADYDAKVAELAGFWAWQEL